MGELQDKLKKIEQLLLEQKGEVKEKKFRYPFGKKVGRSQKKKNYVTIAIINENKVITWKKYQILEQTILHELIPRLATADDVMYDKKGNPVIILPEWSVKPFSPSKNFEDSLNNGSNKKGYQLLMNRMRLSTVEAKKKVGNAIKWIGGLILVGIIVYAVITGGG